MEEVNSEFDTVVECKDCKEPFTITEQQADWFRSKDLDLPKRCPDCRKRRKEENAGK